MREKFPTKRVGDKVAARHVNGLSKVASRFGKLTNAGYMDVQHGDSSISFNGFPPWKQFVLQISNRQINDGDALDSGLYLVKVRYYSHINSEWTIDDSVEYELDGTEFELTGLGNGDRVVAFWDAQRGMFIPISNSVRGRKIHGRLASDMADTDTTAVINQVVAMSGGNPVGGTSTLLTLTVFNKHKHAGDIGGTVTADFCSDDDRWEIVQTDCPVT